MSVSKPHEYSRPIWQIDRNPEFFQVTGQTALSLRCPHCGCNGSFPPIGEGLSYHKFLKGEGTLVLNWVAMRICPSPTCRGIILTWNDDRSIETMPRETISFDPSGIPPHLVRTLSEAVECHSAGAYRASAMMVRRLLEELCHDSNATGSNLHARLDNLRDKIVLSEELFEAMDELKALGNDAAHIEAKAYSNIDKEEAELSIELAREVLKARYQHKSLVERLKSRKGP